MDNLILYWYTREQERKGCKGKEVNNNQAIYVPPDKQQHSLSKEDNDFKQARKRTSVLTKNPR